VCAHVRMRVRSRACACEGRHPLTLLLLPREPPLLLRPEVSLGFQVASSLLLLLHPTLLPCPLQPALHAPSCSLLFCHLLTCCLDTGFEGIAHNKLFVPWEVFPAPSVHAHENQLILPNASFARPTVFLMLATHCEGGQKRLRYVVTSVPYDKWATGSLVCNGFSWEVKGLSEFLEYF